LAWLTYTFFERPLMRRFGTARRRTPAANAPDAASTSPVPAETTT
jgi:peptidoglycan/LPS O-acetylase OafA/YrhL